jgi:hypothetical protein
MLDWRRLSRRLGVALSLRDPPNIPPYGWSYFDHLVAVYVNLNTADPRADAVIQKSHERPDDLTWGDIFLMENINFSLMPPNVVDRSAWILRERFREIACPSIYARYAASNIPTESDTPAKLSLLKADLTRVLDVLHWYYSLIPMRERIRKSLTVKCIFLVILYTIILGAALIWCRWYGWNFLAMLTSVLYVGIIGGFVSSQRRMQSLPSDGDPLISVFGLDNAGYYLWLSPLLGAIFAVILTLMFIAGILKGTVFPAFYDAANSDVGLPFFDFTWSTLPLSAEDYGKLLVWGFLAGFAERLVPDNLDRLASKVSPTSQAAQPPVPSVNSTAPLPGGLPTEETAGSKKAITEEALDNALHTGAPTPEKETKN